MDLSKLNPAQRESVLHTEGPLLVLAGAGSGKTRVLTTRLAYLIEEKGVFETNILAFTFTNKAAQEMKDRVEAQLNRSVAHLWIGTFHSICSRILRRHIDKLGYTSDFTIYDVSEQRQLVKQIIKDKGGTQEGLTPASILSVISKWKNSGVDVKLAKESAQYSRDREIAEIFELYEKEKKANNALDFDDLIGKTLQLLEQEKEIREYYQDKFKYLFVDEYQDTNRSQYELIRILSAKYRNLCVVGDADQSIYGWRGADIKNILDFERDFPEADTILLETNYRSTRPILDLANAVIRNNQQRKEKNLKTTRESDEEILYRRLQSETQEAYWVATQIAQLKYRGIPYEDIAVLFRTNAQSGALEMQFRNEGIPYRMVGGLKFFDRAEVKDLLAYLQALVNPQDDLALERIINTPKRGIGAVSLEKLRGLAQKNSMSMMEYLLSEDQPEFTAADHRKFDPFTNMMKGLKRSLEEAGGKDDPKVDLSKFFQQVFEESGYASSLNKEDTIESRARTENIDAVISLAAEMQENQPDLTLSTYLQNLSLQSELDKTDESQEGVLLMTIHSAKGLEFPVVFITGLEEGLFPSGWSMEEGNLEEERRLLYVAITRAEDLLFLSSAASRRVFGQQKAQMESRFVDEMRGHISEEKPVIDLPSEELYEKRESSRYWVLEKRKQRKKRQENPEEFRPGDRIHHRRMGEGLVVAVKKTETDTELTCTFEGRGIVRLAASVAPIRKLED